MFEITTLRAQHLPEAAELFLAGFRRLRQALPILPEGFDNPAAVCDQLAALLEHGQVTAALQSGRLVGYLGAYRIPGFRGSPRTAAYCPVWAHATVAEQRPAIYRALYRSAAAGWADSGCQVHAITLLANDVEAEKTWFWNGFGLAVVDGVRSLAPLGITPPAGLTLRKAVQADGALLAELEMEHWQHYGTAPIFMYAHAANTAAEFRQLLQDPANSAWLALDHDRPVGYLRFESSEAALLAAPTTTAITGAYVRPPYRGRGVAAALLDAALHDHVRRNFARCAVDFESFNPEAAAFWMRYFEPVAYSLLRIPEKGTDSIG